MATEVSTNPSLTRYVYDVYQCNGWDSCRFMSNNTGISRGLWSTDNHTWTPLTHWRWHIKGDTPHTLTMTHKRQGWGLYFAGVMPPLLRHYKPSTLTSDSWSEGKKRGASLLLSETPQFGVQTRPNSGWRWGQTEHRGRSRGRGQREHGRLNEDYDWVKIICIKIYVRFCAFCVVYDRDDQGGILSGTDKCAPWERAEKVCLHFFYFSLKLMFVYCTGNRWILQQHWRRKTQSRDEQKTDVFDLKFWCLYIYEIIRNFVLFCLVLFCL